MLARCTFRPTIRWAGGSLALTMAVWAGCQWAVDDADREVYRIIEKRQLQAINEVHNARIDEERSPIRPGETAYNFVPHAVESEVPAGFLAAPPTQPTTQPVAESRQAENANLPLAGDNTSQLASKTDVTSSRPARDEPSQGLARYGRRPPSEAVPPEGTTEPASEPDLEDEESLDVLLPVEGTQSTQPTADSGGPGDFPSGAVSIALDPNARALTLADTLAYAFAHARQFQTAKEDLYLAALALSLERHLWTPRMFGEITSQYANYGQIRDFDHAMDAVATVGVRQRLPYGGEVTAQVISSIMRDLTNHITTGETGQMLLQANIPLLRGAGKVAFESRYQAERQLIYAIRTFERFRRVFAVRIAAEYFNLQQLRQQIDNADENIEGLTQFALRARARWRVGWNIELDAQRAEQDLLTGRNNRIDAIERYLTQLDAFKIQIGMPTEESITVPVPSTTATQPAGSTQDASEMLTDALHMPPVNEDEALRVALKYRLDLINDLDRIGDAERGVVVAENGLLPDLQVFGSVRMDTEPDRLGVLKYNSEQTTWRGGVTLELPLDRKAERNALREATILKRRAERDYDESKDTVAQQVRSAMRRVLQQEESLKIQVINQDLARRRMRAAEYRFRKGLVPSLEVVDAQSALLDAQNRLAQAQAELKVAILEFWRDTGTLRIDDGGRWDLLLGPPRTALRAAVADGKGANLVESPPESR